MTPPRARDRRAPTAPTPIPDTDGGLVDRAWVAASEVPARARDAAQRVADRAVDIVGSSAEFMRVVGVACVVASLLYWFAHGFLGWFPERALVEARADVRRLEMALADEEKETAAVRASLYRCLNADTDGDATGEEPQ